MKHLHNKLEKVYHSYNHSDFIPPDPLQYVHRFSRHQDKEIAGFLASALAYGRVEAIQKSMNHLLDIMDNHPYEYVVHFGAAERRRLMPFKHRFNTGRDIGDLLSIFKILYARFQTLENVFTQYYKSGDSTIIPALSQFCKSLLDVYSIEKKQMPGRGLRYLISSPENKSACKRMNLFLRWMVRKDNVDIGLWKNINPAQLIVPLDVHMVRITRMLRFHTQQSVTLKTAVNVTNQFKMLQPDDPVKYDFALSRIGILEKCTGKTNAFCCKCELERMCSRN